MGSYLAVEELWIVNLLFRPLQLLLRGSETGLMHFDFLDIDS